MDGQFVHAESFRNRGKVEIGAGNFFGQRLLSASAGQDDFISTDHGGSLPDLFVRRFAGNGFVRPEAPQIHQRPDGNVQRALGEAVQTEGFCGNEGKIVGNFHRLADSLQLIEAADFGRRVVSGHLAVYFNQQFVQIGLHLFGGRQIFEAV